MRRRLEKWSFQFLVIILFTILILVSLEIGTRYFEKDFKMSPLPPIEQILPPARGFAWYLGQYRFFPYLMYRAPNNLIVANGRAETNSRGLRCPEFPSKKPDGVYRIIVLGGSAAWGIGAATYEQTFSGVMRARLNGGDIKAGKIEVINAAQAGYNSTQELILLEEELLDYDPDFVIFFDGYNDIGWSLISYENFPEGAYWQTPYDYYVMANKLLAPPKTLKNSLLDVMRHSHFLQRASAYMKPKNPNAAPKAPPREEWRKKGLASIERYGKNLELAFSILRHRGIGAAVAVQPMLKMHKQITSSEQNTIAMWWVPYRLDILTELYPKMVDTARAAARNQDAIFWDLIPIFQNHPETVYSDICHYNERGHLIIGEELARLIAPYMPSTSKKPKLSP